VVSLGIFSVVPPTEPRALRSTQPLKVTTRDFSWGKGGRCVRLTNYHPCSAETSRQSRALTYPEPTGPPRPVAGHLSLCVNDMSVLPCRQVGMILNESIMNSLRLLTLSESDNCIQHVILMHELKCRHALNF